MNVIGAGQVEQLRRRNTALVLGVLRSDGPTTRTELARRTGLAKATVGSIVTDLAEVGLAAETGEVTGGRGRPGRAVGLTGANVLGLGLEVNVDYVTAVSLDVAGTVQHTETVPVDTTTPWQVVVNLAARRAAQIRAEGGRLAGTAVAVPGLVASDRRTVRWAPNLGWEERDLGAAVDAATGLAGTVVDNDANCATIAEVSHGAAADADSALYVTGTVGIGAGWVVDGALIRGSSGFAGEVGHLPLGSPGSRCGCGRTGCWEASIGLRAMLSAVGLTDVGTAWETAEAVARSARTDEGIAAALDAVGRLVGNGIAVLAGLADPAVVVLGGYFVPLARWIAPSAERALGERLTFAELHRPELRLSPLGLQGAAIGAAEEALGSVLTGSIASA